MQPAAFAQVTRVLHALDASLLVLRLVGIPQMPADLLIEESLEHMLSLATRSGSAAGGTWPRLQRR